MVACDTACQQKNEAMQAEADEIRKEKEIQEHREQGKTVTSTLFTVIGAGFGIALITFGAPVAGAVVATTAGVIGLATFVGINQGEFDESVAVEAGKLALNVAMPGGGKLATEATKVILLEAAAYKTMNEIQN
jgi:hypothetical protein